MIGSSTRVTQTIFCVIALVMISAPLFAQEGDRPLYVVNSSGTALVPSSDAEDDLELVTRTLGGTMTVLAADGQTVSTSQGDRALAGFGASPDFNDSGMAAFMSAFYDGAIVDENEEGQGLFRWNGGLTLAAQAWSNGDGTEIITNEPLCHMQPMPAINNAGQLLFGFTSDLLGTSTFDDCEDVNSSEAAVEERKGIARWTSPSTLLKFIQSGDPVSVMAPFIGSTTTYYVTDATITHMGAKIFNASGNAVGRILMDNDHTDRADVAGTGDEDPDLNGSGRVQQDDRAGLVYLRPDATPANRYVLIAATGPDSIYQELMPPVMNDSGEVLFKGEERAPFGSEICGLDGPNCDETAASLNLWTLGGGIEAIADTETGTAGIPSSPPNSEGVFQGFSPIYDINNDGQVAFVAGMTIDGNEDDGDDEWGDYQTLILRQPDGTMREIVRSDAAATADGGTGPFTSTIEGFRVDNIGAAVVLAESGNVFYTIENEDPLPDNPCTEGVDPWQPLDTVNPERDFSWEQTAVVGWSPTSGNRILVREGGMWEGARVLRIYIPQPHLRDQTDDGGRLVVKLRLDTDGDCLVDDEDTFTAGAPALPVANAILPADIPALGLTGMLVLGMLLAAAAVFTMRMGS